MAVGMLFGADWKWCSLVVAPSRLGRRNLLFSGTLSTFESHRNTIHDCQITNSYFRILAKIKE